MPHANDNLTTRSKIVISCGFLLIILQVVFQNTEKYKPSYWLEIIANFLMNIFVKLGSTIVKIAMKIAGFISFQSIAIALYELVHPFIQIISSPYYTINGIIFGITLSQFDAIITFIIFLIIFLIILENQCNKEYRPTIFFAFVHEWTKKFYDFVCTIGMEFLQFYRLFGLDKFVENFIKIVRPLIDIILTPVLSFASAAANIASNHYGITIFLGLLTVEALYFYGAFTLVANCLPS